MRERRFLPGMPPLAVNGALLAVTLSATAVPASAQSSGIDFQPERGTLLMPKDCRYELDKARCAADNRAIEFCRSEKDTNTVYICLRANQSPLPCAEKKSDSGKKRCERINRVYQPCKGKRGAELAACVDQHRVREKRKK